MLNEGIASKTLDAAFDVATLRERSTMKMVDDSGRQMTIRSNERFYMPSEIHWMLETLGFRAIKIFGCMPGKFSRKTNPSSNDFELLAAALKKPTRQSRVNPKA